MKNILIPLLWAAIAFQTALANEIADVLHQARELVAKKQYLAAYRLVEKADPKHRDLEAVLFKFDLLTNYYACRIGVDLFALRDLAAKERIEDIRGEAGTFDTFLFETEKTLKRMLEEHPEEARIHRALGLFYYKELGMHPDAKTADGKSYADNAFEHLDKTLKEGLEDDSTRFALGHLELSRANYAKSIPHFEKCIELNPGYAAAHFNLASARFELGSNRDALGSAKNAFELYAEPELKSDAASLAGDILAELGEDKDALRYYELADQIRPNAYPNIKSLLRMRLRQNAVESDATAQRLMALDPENPTVYGDLEQVYMATRQTDRLIRFYTTQLQSPQDTRPPVATGNMHFYLARLYLESKPQLARQHFNSAKSYFEKKFQADHPVFKIIEAQLGEESADP